MPDDIHRLIFHFAFNKSNITPKKFLHECNRIEQIKHCVPQSFLRPVVYSLLEKQLIPNPYKEFMPYTPLTTIQHASFLQAWVTERLWGLNNKFFSRVHSYRSTFKRYLYRLNCYGIPNHWNRIYIKYLVHISIEDFIDPSEHDLSLVEALEAADCF
jgi:hypothetical protein